MQPTNISYAISQKTGTLKLILKTHPAQYTLDKRQIQTAGVRFNNIAMSQHCSSKIANVCVDKSH